MAAGQKRAGPLRVDYPAGATTVEADLWSGGRHGLVLAVPTRAEHASWAAVAPSLAGHGLAVLMPYLPGPLLHPLPEAAAPLIAGGCELLRDRDASAVSVLGSGAAATAAGEAVIAGATGPLHTLILLAPDQLSAAVGEHQGNVQIITADEDAETTMNAFRQQQEGFGSVEVTVYAGDWPSAALLDSPHASSLLARIRAALPPDATA